MSIDKILDKPLAFYGEVHTVREWASMYGCEPESFAEKVDDAGFDIGQALKAKACKRERLIEYKGRKQNLRQWADELGVPYYSLRSRLNNLHWTVKKAFETPFGKDGREND